MAQQIVVKVIPRAARNELVSQPDGSYKARLTAAPVEGKANEQLVVLLSEDWQVAKSRIRIVKGTNKRTKVIEIM